MKKQSKQSLAFLVSGSLVLATVQGPYAAGAPMPQPNAQTPTVQPPTVQATPQSPEKLDQLVAPIALYPDTLIAQILAASIYPTEIVEADRWMQQHSSLKGEELAKEVGVGVR